MADIFRFIKIGGISTVLTKTPVAGFHRALIPPPLWMRYLVFITFCIVSWDKIKIKPLNEISCVSLISIAIIFCTAATPHENQNIKPVAQA